MAWLFVNNNKGIFWYVVNQLRTCHQRISIYSHSSCCLKPVPGWLYARLLGVLTSPELWPVVKSGMAETSGWCLPRLIDGVFTSAVLWILPQASARICIEAWFNSRCLFWICWYRSSMRIGKSTRPIVMLPNNDSYMCIDQQEQPGRWNGAQDQGSLDVSYLVRWLGDLEVFQFIEHWLLVSQLPCWRRAQELRKVDVPA